VRGENSEEDLKRSDFKPVFVRYRMANSSLTADTIYINRSVLDLDNDIARYLEDTYKVPIAYMKIGDTVYIDENTIRTKCTMKNAKSVISAREKRIKNFLTKKIISARTKKDIGWSGEFKKQI
jgi:hypothetical protein